MAAWKVLRKGLNTTYEKSVALEKDLIRVMVKMREEKGLFQAQLAEQCHVKPSSK